MIDRRPKRDGPSPSILTVLTGAEVYAPAPLGRLDVVIAGGRVVMLDGEAAETLAGDHTRIVQLADAFLAPGLVDGHVHFLGGGGGDGYDSRSPELQLSDFTGHGITTAVAPLGIDPVSRSLEGLLAKARALREGGISAYVYTGGFRKPLLHLSGSVWRDGYLIPDVLGVKLAIGVERAPSHSRQELADLSRELLWVERATGRRLVLHVHLGVLTEGHALVQELADVLADRDRLVVTHLNRTPHHVETAIKLARLGVWTDLTCMISPERGMPGSMRASAAAIRLREAGVPMERVTLSTDGNGSVPERGKDGRWRPYRKHMDSLLDELRALVVAGFGLDEALALATVNPASALGLSAKGRITDGADADVLVFGAGLKIRDVYARGRLMVAGGEVIEIGRYERGET